MPEQTEQQDKKNNSRLKAALVTIGSTVITTAAVMFPTYRKAATLTGDIFESALFEGNVDGAFQDKVTKTAFPQTYTAAQQWHTNLASVIDTSRLEKEMRPIYDAAKKEFNKNRFERVPGGTPTVAAISATAAAAAGYGIYRHVQKKKAAKAGDAQPETHVQKLAAERGYDAAHEKPDAAHTGRETQRQATSHETGQTR